MANFDSFGNKGKENTSRSFVKSQKTLQAEPANEVIKAQFNLSKNFTLLTRLTMSMMRM